MCTLLHVACLQARHSYHIVGDDDLWMVKLLLEGKGDPTIYDSHGESAIEFAQRKNARALLELLQPSAPCEVRHLSDSRSSQLVALPTQVPGGVSFTLSDGAASAAPTPGSIAAATPGSVVGEPDGERARSG